MVLTTTTVPKISAHIMNAKVHNSVKESIHLNLSVLADSVLSSLADRMVSIDYMLACVAFCQALTKTLRLRCSPVDSAGGFEYDAQSNTLVCDPIFKTTPLGYPEGIWLSIVVLEIVKRAISLQTGITYSNLDLSLKTDDFDDEHFVYSRVFQEFSKFENAREQSSTIEEYEFSILTSKWFGDAKPSYISEDLASQISSVLEIKYGSVEGIHDDVLGFLEANYYESDLSPNNPILLTKSLSKLLNETVFIRSNDYDRVTLSSTLPSSLFNHADTHSIRSAYDLISYQYENPQDLQSLRSMESIRLPYGLYATRSSNNRDPVQFIFSYGNFGSVRINAQEAWWALML